MPLQTRYVVLLMTYEMIFNTSEPLTMQTPIILQYLTDVSICILQKSQMALAVGRKSRVQKGKASNQRCRLCKNVGLRMRP
jgi:hypothetical protein